MQRVVVGSYRRFGSGRLPRSFGK